MSRRHWLISIFTFLMGALASSYIYLLSKTNTTKALQTELNYQSKSIHEKLQDTWHLAEENLLALRALYASSQFVNREEFHIFAQGIIGNNSHIQALEWVERVPFEQKLSFEKKVQAMGYRDFFIKEKSNHFFIPVKQRNEYYPITYIEPFIENQMTHGFDLSSEKQRNDALMASHHSNSITASSKVLLMQGNEKIEAFLAFAPFYSNIKNQYSSPKHLKGFTIGVFLIEKIIHKVISKARENELNIFIYELKNSGEKSTPIYLSDPQSKLEDLIEICKKKYGINPYQSSIEIADKKWQITIIPKYRFIKNIEHHVPISLFFVSLLISALMSLIVHLYFLSHAKALKVSLLNQELGEINTHLEDKVSERTQEIESHLKQLQDQKKSIVTLMNESKLAQTQEMELRQFSDTVIQNSPHGLILVDNSGNIKLTNQASEKIFGYARDELIGQKIEQLIDPQIRSRHIGLREEYTKNPRSINLSLGRDITGVTKDGSIIAIEVVLTPIQSKKGLVILASIVDITERKKNEQSLKELNEKMQESNLILESNHIELQFLAEDLKRLNQDLEQFAYATSHDLQEPLKKISSFIQILNEELKGKLNQETEKYFTFITDSANRMSQLIKDLLDFSRAGNTDLEFHKIDMEYLVKEVLNNLEPIIKEKNASIVVKTLPTLDHASPLLAQVFQNFITNAIKFCPANRNPDITIDALEFEKEYQFCIQDNGIGIDAQYTTKVFEVFKRLHSRAEYSGSGIGLSICQRLIQRHGGKIWVESEPGKGSTFFFTIPKTIPKY